ncbi:hypothetical protein L6452_06943 [Arctium lappa]|uniref:Uncharacterized protein n=1 Tax=Arctium lappa TaxID=4217 RepID=A0ACB9EKV6_ARCLA|nr:hypothetical protein L6452_06943 [Arctium lappa]
MLKEQQSSVPNFPFFPNPNPGLLLRSFDIPEPVIHPPGIDPYSAVNPNPPSDYGLPALDIDPSAVSQTQIISRTTDLTVSEHAGGSLSEPAIESTTSYSPANSQVVVEKTVNNVTVPNIRSNDTPAIFCDVCNIACYTEDVLKKHKEGKRHKKKVQKLAAVSPAAITQEMLPHTKDASLHQPEKKKQDLSQSEASVDSLFVLGVPDAGCINQNIFTGHIEGEKLAAQVTSRHLCKDMIPNPTSVSLTTVQPSTDKAQDKLNVYQTGCEVCKVSCTSDKSLQRHILGKKHKKTLKISEKIISLSLTPIASMATIPGSLKSTEGNLVDSEKLKVCPSTRIATTPPSLDLSEHVNSTKGETVHSEELCKVSCSSNVRSIYESGKKHVKNLERSEKIPDLPLNPLICSLATPGNVEIPNSEENKSSRCELCGIRCNSYDEFNKHVSGKKHRKNVKKTEEKFGVGCEGSMEDERCKRKAKWESDEDPDRKKQKMMMEEEKALISCKVCNVVCISLMAFTSHLASHEHSVMALKQVEVEAE